MDVLIREARIEDAEGIVTVFNPIIETGAYTIFDAPLTVEDERNYLANFPERGVLVVAIRPQDQRIVGFQSMEPFAGYTHAFDHVGVVGTYVDLAFRRQKISQHLFAATFEAAKQKGYEKIFTFVRADNPAALATYLGQGFQQIGIARKQAKIKGEYVDEIIIEKFL